MIIRSPFLVAAFIFFPVIIKAQTEEPLPGAVKSSISKIEFGKIGGMAPTVQYAQVTKDIFKVSLSWDLAKAVKQDDWQLNISPAFVPDFHWAPHLTPTDNHIIAQHVFRAPALIVSSKTNQLTIIPDLDLLKKGSPVDWYMDLNAKSNVLTMGLSKSKITDHVLYERAAGGNYPAGKMQFGFYILINRDKAALTDPWRGALAFMWEKWGEPLYQIGEPMMRKDMQPLVKHTYDWAFNTWKKSVWQEFELNGKKVGAPVFIVNVTQSPNYPGVVDEREFRSVWNQAWFNSLRSAQGLYRYARRTNNTELLDYATKTKELALSFPQKHGFFPGLIATEMETVTIDGKKYNRSKGWNTLYFGNSNRNPYTWDAKESPYHVLDMSFTAWLMLTWYQELEPDKRLLAYATTYANALLGIQDKDGFFPGWLSKDNFKPLSHLNRSPETSMSVTFLLKLYELTKDKKYQVAALRAMNAVMVNNVPVGQWEDFETYWSCSRYGSENLVDKKVERNNMFKQNTFSMFWTAEALFNAYKATGSKKYLTIGQRTLDEMLMTQATWQPPYIYVNALGGFGVMNADGEWNDSRQSIFAELIVKYGKELNKKEYIQRGLAALRASFVMMYAPENPKTKAQWEKRWNFFGKEDYGFMMENYGHGGETNAEGVGIGEFTIYDWGNGAAAEAYNRMLDHYSLDFINGN